MIKPILKYPNPILNQVSLEVTDFDDELRSLLKDMRDTLIDAKGVGISAVQIGVLKRVCTVACYSSTSREVEFVDMVNPIIIDHSEESSVIREGCLSCPGLFVPKRAYNDVTVKYQDLDGAEHLKSFSDEICANTRCCGGSVMARCCQHELEHMTGVLIIDAIPAYKKADTIKKWKRSHK